MKTASAPSRAAEDRGSAAGPVTVLALYRFASLPDAAELREPLAQRCCSLGIKGTLILAPEGINGTVAGTHEAIAALEDFLFGPGPFGGRLAGAEVKRAHAETMPFLRLKVRLKPEIVTLRAPEADPARAVGTHVAPEDWNGVISRPGIRLIDTRNAYETRLGTFAGAEDPGLETFEGFKAYVETALDPARDTEVAMFCTGGIRCEKASSYLLAKGFKTIYHLEGGILAYLETVAPDESRWEGECFVFDERVAVGQGLHPSETVLCRACREPVTADEQRDPAYVPGVSCPRCADRDNRRARARDTQIAHARKTGDAHLGDAARDDANRRRAEKRARAEADRVRSAEKR